MGEKEKEDYANAAKELEEIFKKRIEQEKAMILNKAYKNFIEKIISKAISKAREQFLSLNDQDLRNINKRYFDSFGVEYDK
jgi:F-type H+-transporting ATPase subunit b